MINRQRVIDCFKELVSIDSVSLKEKKFAEHLKDRLEKLGFETRFDEGLLEYDGEVGNLIAFKKGILEKDAIVLSAHMDTVVPGENIRPVEDEDIIRSSGDTILGADDKSGIAGMLEAAEVIREKKLDHGPLYYLFTFAEEVGLCGAKTLDVDSIDAQMYFFLDSSGEVGKAIVSGPSQDSITAEFTGKAAHAGLAPEEGISSIVAAGKAVSSMKLGRIDIETTSNMGKIQGGKATNIVPEKTILHGEARSRSDEKLDAQTRHMVEMLKKAAQETGCQVEVRVNREYSSFNLKENDEIVQRVKRAVEKMGKKFITEASGGGSDTNIISGKGRTAINLAAGMEKVHTTNEQIKKQALVDVAQLVLNIIID